MPLGQIVFFVFIAVVAGYVIYRVKTLKAVENRLKRMALAAEGHNSRVDEAIRVSREQTAAMTENTTALRELIEINRQLLEKQSEPKS